MGAREGDEVRGKEMRRCTDFGMHRVYGHLMRSSLCSCTPMSSWSKIHCRASTCLGKLFRKVFAPGQSKPAAGMVYILPRKLRILKSGIASPSTGRLSTPPVTRSPSPPLSSTPAVPCHPSPSNFCPLLLTLPLPTVTYPRHCPAPSPYSDSASSSSGSRPPPPTPPPPSASESASASPSSRPLHPPPSAAPRSTSARSATTCA